MAKILNLDSLIDRPVVVIKGAEYWLLTPDIMPPLDTHRVQQMFKRVSTLVDKPELTEEEQQELKALPDSMCRIVLQAADDVHAGLTDSERMLTVETALTTFRSGQRMTPPSAAAPAPVAESPSTGANGSRG